MDARSMSTTITFRSDGAGLRSHWSPASWTTLLPASQRQNDWGSYLREIDKALDARVKTTGKRTPEEQFYAEVRVALDGVRIAWRNATMHIENSYSAERAEEILVIVRSLMRHLAT